jgi:hypothetical protein
MNFNDTTIRIAVKEYLQDNIKTEKNMNVLHFGTWDKKVV